ncbi:hypothetical protein Pla52nx_004198 [Stieleria varia]
MDSGSLFMDFYVGDEDEQNDTMDDFKGVSEPPEFAALLKSRSLCFVIVNCSEAHAAAVNSILDRLRTNGIIDFDATDDVSVLDGSPILS